MQQKCTRVNLYLRARHDLKTATLAPKREKKTEKEKKRKNVTYAENTGHERCHQPTTWKEPANKRYTQENADKKKPFSFVFIHKEQQSIVLLTIDH